MESALCELLELVLHYLDPPDYARLLRTSSALRRASLPLDEWYLSCTRLVRVYRRAKLEDGLVQFTWMSGLGSEQFELEPRVGARAILDELWALKKARDDERWTLFVDCVVWPDPCMRSTPCYLFKTDEGVRYLRECCDGMDLLVDNGWPVWISCSDHPYRRCRRCPYPCRFDLPNPATLQDA